jgi:adenine-specific DNA-methyltransferase
MAEKEIIDQIKTKIESAIKSFSNGSLFEKAISLFDTLGYNTTRQNQTEQKTFDYFKESYLENNNRFNEEKALVKEWKTVDLLFQLTVNEVSGQKNIFETKRVDNTIIESYLFFAVELSGDEYTRTAMANITREINKVFPMPVMVLFKYGSYITLSVINRRLNKKDEQKDVLEKVTLIKDISVLSPHRAHREILFDLSFDELNRDGKITNFVELHNAWQKTLDVKELNNRFYKELSNWYFWALHEVSFPADSMTADRNNLFKEEERVKENNAKNLIRLLTRILFVWFIKEKKLIPVEIFEMNFIGNNLIKGFHPDVPKNNEKRHEESRYYKSILQNLFFATLNCPIISEDKKTTRGFRKSDNYGQHQDANFLMRYEKYFKDTDLFIKLLNDKVPFMNGGLFECLDDKTNKIYVDGFSDNLPKKHNLTVPDCIFFGTKDKADLSKELDDKNKKNVKVEGLFKILEHYKFTVAENTPIEEDVALDPELLGRVFENLLASYNPETKTTARKQTGSFYTPREIVNYMVDESLKAYLKQKLETEAGMGIAQAEQGLEILIGYNESGNPFDEKQTLILINAIDTCKILDPACGSGAFPMGILHKLVHILHKLDPQNKLWKERQIEKAQKIDDAEIRDNLINDIETAFANNELDYGRKLYLIENCIYGVDIQPIATQISKLRFFISLVVDQKVDKSKENFGVRSLPNLETKFVAANTLIDIEKPKDQGEIFVNPKVNMLEEKLKDIRHRLFSAKTPATKRRLRDEDEKLREEMSLILQAAGWSNESARQLAGWNPYNQNASSLFFDSEWMFGINEGFDVVIGNPPYIDSKRLKHISQTFKKFTTFAGNADIYVYFYEKGIILLKENGILSFITSNKWIRSEYGRNLRKFFLQHSNPLVLIDFGVNRIFEATVDSNVIFIQKLKNKNNFKICSISDKTFNTNNLFDYLRNDLIQSPNFTEDAWLLSTGNKSNLKDKIRDNAVPLKNWNIQINYGIKTGFNEAFIIDENTKNKLISEDKNSIDVIKPMLRGKNIKKYTVDFEGLYLLFIPWHFPLHKDTSITGFSMKAEKLFQKQYPAVYNHLCKYKSQLLERNKAETGIRYEWYALQRCAATYLDEFDKDKIIWQAISKNLGFGFTGKGIFSDVTTFFMTGENLQFFLAIFNSTFFEYALLNIYLEGDTFKSKNQIMLNFPIPKTTEYAQKSFINLVDQILDAKKVNPNVDTSKLEKQIDELVYKLYDLTEDEIAIIEGSVK